MLIKQLQYFRNFASACRYICNFGLENRKRAYEENRETVGLFDLNNTLPYLKRAEATSWLKEVHSQILQQSLKDLDLAFENFFRRVRQKEKLGYPKFKKREEEVAQFSRNLADAGWGQFLRFLQYKLTYAGKMLVQASRWFASTKTCSCCRWQREMPLHERVYHCECRNAMDRDANAAANIRDIALTNYKAAGTTVESLWSCPVRGSYESRISRLQAR